MNHLFYKPGGAYGAVIASCLFLSRVCICLLCLEGRFVTAGSRKICSFVCVDLVIVFSMLLFTSLLLIRGSFGFLCLFTVKHQNDT